MSKVKVLLSKLADLQWETETQFMGVLKSRSSETLVSESGAVIALKDGHVTINGESLYTVNIAEVLNLLEELHKSGIYQG